MVIQRMTWLQARRWRFSCEVRAIRKYIETSTAALKRTYVELLASIHSEIPHGCDREEAESIYSQYQEEFSHFDDRFPAIASSSLFLTIFSLFEQQMSQICEGVREEKGLQIGVEDLQGEGMGKYRKYLEKVCGVSYPQTKEAHRMDLFRRIRNAFAHGQGRLKKDQGEDIRQLAKQSPKTISVSFNEIRLTPRFCLGALDTIEKFLDQLEPHLPATRRI